MRHVCSAHTGMHDEAYVLRQRSRVPNPDLFDSPYNEMPVLHNLLLYRVSILRPSTQGLCVLYSSGALNRLQSTQTQSAWMRWMLS